ncbi:hypothetical protein AAG747_10500 [Rapidithrix thailandica]|uniref:Nuclear transport factor 2 family protein n=1 Tax=Rapidithrix thailandica TaxID=413964 RepID=A0AAW9RUB1_9BACT
MLGELVTLATTKVSSYKSTDSNVDDALQYYHPQMISDVTRININGKIRKEQNTYEDLKEQLSNLARNELTTVHNITVSDIFVQAKDVGIIRFTDTYEHKYKGKLMQKGTQLVTATAKKQKEGWRILYMSIVEVENEKLLSICPCQLFEGQGSEDDFVTKTTIPQGTTTKDIMESFVFRNNQKHRYIRAGEDIFTWTAKNDVWTINGEGAKLHKVGKAESKAEAIQLILQKKYTENCINIVINN